MEALTGKLPERPLEVIRREGGFAGIFQTIGCIGDSLASGEFEFKAANEDTKPVPEELGDHPGGVYGNLAVRDTPFGKRETGYWDCYWHSWGKYMERSLGNTVRVYARGGQTAKAMWEEGIRHTSPCPQINELFEQESLCQAYIVALGVNDLFGGGTQPGFYPLDAGDVERDVDVNDYRNNGESFIGYYAKIIQKLQSMRADAKFFLVSIPRGRDADEMSEKHAKLLADLCRKLPNCYLLDLYNEAPVYDESMKKIFYSGGHMNAMGYQYTAWVFLTYIDWIIRKNPEDFTRVQYIGSARRPW